LRGCTREGPPAHARRLLSARAGRADGMRRSDPLLPYHSPYALATVPMSARQRVALHTPPKPPHQLMNGMEEGRRGRGAHARDRHGEVARGGARGGRRRRGKRPPSPRVPKARRAPPEVHRRGLHERRARALSLRRGARGTRGGRAHAPLAWRVSVRRPASGWGAGSSSCERGVEWRVWARQTGGAVKPGVKAGRGGRACECVSVTAG